MSRHILSAARQAGVLDLADGVHLGVVVVGRRLGLQEEPEVLVPLLLPLLLRVRQDLPGTAAFGRHPLPLVPDAVVVPLRHPGLQVERSKVGVLLNPSQVF